MAKSVEGSSRQHTGFIAPVGRFIGVQGLYTISGPPASNSLVTQDKPNLSTLKSTLHYIENIASTETEERKQKHMAAANKLRSIIEYLDQQLRGMFLVSRNLPEI